MSSKVILQISNDGETKKGTTLHFILWDSAYSKDIFPTIQEGMTIRVPCGNNSFSSHKINDVILNINPNEAYELLAISFSSDFSNITIRDYLNASWKFGEYNFSFDDKLPLL